MSAHNLASKFRRAIRNGTGASFTHDQLRELGEYGVLRSASCGPLADHYRGIDASGTSLSSSGIVELVNVRPFSV